jgi:hypothetical protein
MPERSTRNATPVQAVGLATVILAPRHFVRVLMEVLAADSMMDAVFGPAKPAEPTLGLVHACAIIADKFSRVIDAAHVVGRMQRIPSRALAISYFADPPSICSAANFLALARMSRFRGCLNQS